VPEIERLVDLLSAQYRWGAHPFKLLVALLAPVLIVWVADRRLRALSEAIPSPRAGDPPAAEPADTVITTR
jgi:hypothetical protein